MMKKEERESRRTFESGVMQPREKKLSAVDERGTVEKDMVEITNFFVVM